MDGHPATAALQRGLVGAHQILGLFLEFHIGVADQPELPLADHPVAREQAMQGEEGMEVDGEAEVAPVQPTRPRECCCCP